MPDTELELFWKLFTMRRKTHRKESVSDFEQTLFDEFINSGGKRAYLGHVLEQANAIPFNSTASDAAYIEKNRLRISKFRAIKKRAFNLLVDMRLLNQELEEGKYFHKDLLQAITQIEERAAKFHQNLRFKRSRGGQVVLLRRLFFISALMPYIRFKKLHFGEQKTGITLWAWLLNCDSLLLGDLDRELTQESLRKWWGGILRSSNPEVFNTLLSGAGQYIWWSRRLQGIDRNRDKDLYKNKKELPFNAEERRYAQTARQVLKPLSRKLSSEETTAVNKSKSIILRILKKAV